MIDLEGSVKNVEVIRKLDDWSEQEILSVFQSIPKLSQYDINRWNFRKSKNYIGIFIIPIIFIIKID
jgi:hypothetical protein